MTATWRDYLPQFLAEQPDDGSGAVRSVSVVRAVEGGDAPPNGPNGPNGTHRDEARVGLARLRDMRAPAGVISSAWVQVVADAEALAEQGWVAHALGLG